MKSQRIGIHLVSTLLLLLWGGVLIYFYASGRVVHYLTSDGIFRPMVLWGGIGLVVLGLYNLATIGSKESGCCEHDHDHKHDGPHDHTHKEGCCGHDHGHHHEPAPTHRHKEGECCGHDHHHDHGHGHSHSHDHGHDGEEHGHAHGILEESGSLGRMVALFLLVVPVSYAAVKTSDRFNAKAMENKGVYDQKYDQPSANADQYALNKNVAATPTAPAPAQTPPDPSQGPAPAVNPKEIEKQAAKGAESKSFGSFTLADLKSQVPQSPEGNFMLEVPELYYTAGDKEVQGVLTGQPVETIAQVLPEKVNNDKGTRLRIFRLLVQCCAADARPYSIPVEFGKTAPAFKDMSWVKVTGKMTYKKEGDQTVPVIEATSITEAAEPANGMVY